MMHRINFLYKPPKGVLLVELTLRQKIGQLVLYSLDGRELDEAAVRTLRDYCVGNVIHFGNNVQGLGDARALNDALTAEIRRSCADIPPLLCIDHEGGRVMRFAQDLTWFPSHLALSAADDEELTCAVGRAMGEELAAAGFQLNFAPVVDIISAVASPVIGVRSFGDMPERVICHAAAFCRGMQSAGVMACLKHFPGHGSSTADSHYFLPTVDMSREELEATGLAPYRALCREKAAGAIMTAHILFPQIEPGVPATMSPEILTGILRRDIGFDGIVFSDGIQMKAIAEHYGMERGCIAAIRAGVDIVCIGTGGSGSQEAQIACMEALYQAALSGEISMERIDEAVAHVLAGKAVYCSRPTPPAPDFAAHAALSAEVCRRAITRLSGGTVTGRVLYASAPVKELAFGLTHADPRQLTFGQMAAMHTGGAYTTLDRLGEARDYDALVIGMQNVREDSIELAAAREAYAQGKQVALVLMNTPYGAQHLPKEYDIVCSYSHTPAAVAAAIDALTGKAQPMGTLPVTLD